MDISITKTFKGKDGSEVRTFEAGKTYFIADKSLVEVILSQKWGVLDIFAIPSVETTEVSAPEEGKAATSEYEKTSDQVRLLPVKELKAIIEDEGFEIDTKGKKQQELAEAVVQALKTKYKGF